MHRDLSQLYTHLGLQPGCTVEELKAAYRRRITQLHPDRTGQGREDARVLEELVWLYSTATRFERMHGRLPGAPARLLAGAPQTAARPHAGTDHASRRQNDEPRDDNRLHLAMLALPILALTILTLISGDWSPPTDRSSRLTPIMLSQGMDAQKVRVLLGEPNRIDGSRWYYGRSWIQFQNARVSGWSSDPGSPLPGVKALGSIPDG